MEMQLVYDGMLFVDNGSQALDLCLCFLPSFLPSSFHSDNNNNNNNKQQQQSWTHRLMTLTMEDSIHSSDLMVGNEDDDGDTYWL